MVHTLAERRGLTAEHARQWLTHVGLHAPLEGVEGDPDLVAAARAVLEEGVHQLADTVRNSLNFYRMQESAEQVEQGVLTGPAVAIPGFVEALSEQLRLPARRRAVVADGRRSTGRRSRRSGGRGARLAVERDASPGVSVVDRLRRSPAFIGAIFGSFLNVVAYRLPRGESLSHPRSRCPGCETPIKPYDNVPVLSWLALRGRCRACGARISRALPARRGRHGPAVRASWCSPRAPTRTRSCGLVSRAAARPGHADRPRPPDHPEQADDHRRGRGAGVRRCWLDARRDLVEHLIAGVAAGGFFLVAALAYPRGMGMGDVKLAAVLGLFLGRAVGPAMFIALISGTLVGALDHRPQGRRTKAARPRSRSARSSPSAGSSACSRATRSSTGTSTPSA